MTITIIALAIGVTCLPAADRKVEMKDLPPAAQKTVLAEEAKGATPDERHRVHREADQHRVLDVTR